MASWLSQREEQSCMRGNARCQALGLRQRTSTLWGKTVEGKHIFLKKRKRQCSINEDKCWMARLFQTGENTLWGEMQDVYFSFSDWEIALSKDKCWGVDPLQNVSPAFSPSPLVQHRDRALRRWCGRSALFSWAKRQSSIRKNARWPTLFFKLADSSL